MTTLTLSPKYQVVIPKAVRERHALSPGDKIAVFDVNGRIELIPVRPVKTLRGLLKGYDVSFEREKQDRDIG